MKESEQTPPAVARVRADIIKGVLTRGLVPSAKLKKEGIFHLASANEDPCSYIEGCILKPPLCYSLPSYNRGYTAFAIFEALYANRNSILPVVLEREGKNDSLAFFYCLDGSRRGSMRAFEKELANRRMAASFLTVYMTTEEVSICRRSEDKVTADQIAYVLMPKDIHGEYMQFGSQVPQINTPLKVIEGRREVKGVLGLTKDILMVPDYERALVEVLKEVDRPIWIHGVRLPVDQAEVH